MHHFVMETKWHFTSEKMPRMDFLLSVKFTDGIKTDDERKQWQDEFNKFRVFQLHTESNYHKDWALIAWQLTLNDVMTLYNVIEFFLSLFLSSFS